MMTKHEYGLLLLFSSLCSFLQNRDHKDHTSKVHVLYVTYACNYWLSRYIHVLDIPDIAVS